MTVKIGIYGCNGRMGQTLMKAVEAAEGAELVGGADKGDDIKALVDKADAIIDFTRPEATLDLAEIIAEQGKVQIIGTTGFTDEEFAELKSYGAKARIFQAGNMSVGVNLMNALIQKAASLLDESYDVEIVEMHHRHKVDAPSGTALMMGEAAANGRGVSLKDKQVLSREGHTGERNSGDIGFATLRGGSVIGDHTAIFAGDSDRIEITHKSSSREIYAEGAIKAAIWANSQPNGFYSMQDLLSID